MMVSIVDNATFKLDIGTANTNSYNLVLWDLFTAKYPYVNTGATVEFTVLGNIGSTSTSTYALQTGTWPAGSNIKLILPAISGGDAKNPANGVIAGMGGAAISTGCCDIYGATTNLGGPAILLSYPLTIANSGVIGSGGTGGLAITQNRDNNALGDGGGGAGINPGYSFQGRYNYTRSQWPSSYLFGGASVGWNGGDLGQAGGSGRAPAKAVVTQGNILTLTGNPLLGGQS
jgi:hypothetical protein